MRALKRLRQYPPTPFDYVAVTTMTLVTHFLLGWSWLIAAGASVMWLGGMTVLLILEDVFVERQRRVIEQRGAER